LSDIPFARQLRRELAAAITEPAADTHRRRRRLRGGRRLGVLAVAAVLVIGGTAVAAQLLTQPERLAATEVDCLYDPVNGSGVGIHAGGQDPVAACRAFLAGHGKALAPGGVPASLVACVRNDPPKVVVIAGRQGDCQRYKLGPLPGAYAPAHEKVAKLGRDLQALEGSAECIPLKELARRVQALLDRSGWTGWTTWVRSDISDGPCGHVLGVSEDGGRSIAGALDLDGHRVMVFGEAPPATVELLKRLSPALAKESAARCYTVEELKILVRQRVAPTGRRVSFKASVAPLAKGCAVVEKVGPDANGRDLVALIDKKR
jgi:hypothetical protein